MLSPTPKTKEFTGNTPSLSPDGRFLLFQSMWSGGHNSFVAILDLERGTPLRLTEGDCFGVRPHFSPDGKTIVFSSSRTGTFDLHVMERSGSRLKRLTTGDLIADEGGTFSPDGTTIVFGTSDKGLYTIGRDGSNRKRTLDRGHHPSFSPDGRKVLFEVDSGKPQQPTRGRRRRRRQLQNSPDPRIRPGLRPGRQTHRLCHSIDQPVLS